MTISAPAEVHTDRISRAVSLLLNVGHGIDHMFLLIFATAVASIATEFGYANWTDLMPFSVGAFALFEAGQQTQLQADIVKPENVRSSGSRETSRARRRSSRGQCCRRRPWPHCPSSGCHCPGHRSPAG